MNLHLSIKSLKATDVVLFFQAGLSLALMLSLASCSAFKSNDYSIRDSLYVWSDSFDTSTEASTEYQTISSLEESILKSDVQLIFEAMVNKEIVETVLSEKQQAEKELAPKVIKKPDITPEQERELVETATETFIGTDFEPKTEITLVAQQTQTDAELLESEKAVQEINRLTLENPTAAGIPVREVLPQIQKEVAEIELPKAISILSGYFDYQLADNEYGMWQLVKNDVRQHQEVCSLSSSTMQVEAGNYTTQVWLKVVGNDLLVNSTTNIDIEKPQVGVKFDNGALQAFKKNYFQTSAVWSGDLEGVLKKNKQISISLGGNELGKRTQELAVGLTDLKKAYSEYRKCNRGTQIGSL